MVNDTSSKKHVCPYEGCKSSFPRPSKLAYHIQLHEGKKPFQCEFEGCHKGYTTKAHLKRHESIHFEHTTERAVCSVEDCKKDFSNVANLQKHMKRAHNPDRVYNYICAECNQSFPKKKLLHQHTYLHTGEFHYKCSVCDQGFHLLSELNRHKNAHVLHVCSECNASFKQWVDLRKHKNTHKLLFKCSNCNYTTYKRVLLKSHEDTHIAFDQRKQFKCMYQNCARSYMYMSNLRNHVQQVHNQQKKDKIPCPMHGCEVKLSKMNCLKKHIEVIHNKALPVFNRPRRIRKDCGKPRANILVQLIGKSIQENLDSLNSIATVLVNAK